MHVEVEKYPTREQVLQLAWMLELPGDSKNQRGLSPTPREPEWIGLVVGLGVGISKRSPGNADEHQVWEMVTRTPQSWQDQLSTLLMSEVSLWVPGNENHLINVRTSAQWSPGCLSRCHVYDSLVLIFSQYKYCLKWDYVVDHEHPRDTWQVGPRSGFLRKEVRL